MNPDTIPTIPGLIISAALWCVLILQMRKDRRP